MLAVAVGADVLESDPAVIVREHVFDLYLEGSVGLLNQATEQTEHLLLALVVARKWAVPGLVPDDIVREQSVHRCHVPASERVVALAHLLQVRVLSHGQPPSSDDSSSIRPEPVARKGDYLSFMSSGSSHLSHLECARCDKSHDSSLLQQRCECGGTLLARYDLS